MEKNKSFLLIFLNFPIESQDSWDNIFLLGTHIGSEQENPEAFFNVFWELKIVSMWEVAYGYAKSTKR